MMMKVDKCFLPPIEKPIEPRCNIALADGVFDPARVVVDGGCVVSVEQSSPFTYTPDPCGEGGSTGGGGSGGGGSGGLSSVSVGNTATVSMAGSGTTSSPITANVRKSSNSGNVLELRSDGLYVPAASGGGGSGGGGASYGAAVYTTSTSTVVLSGNGATTSDPLQARVAISPDPSNALLSRSNGLFVSMPDLSDVMTTDPSTGNLVVNVQVYSRCDGSSSICLSGSGTSSNPISAQILFASEDSNGNPNGLAELVDDNGIKKLYAKAERFRGYLINRGSGLGSGGHTFYCKDDESGACMYMGVRTATLSGVLDGSTQSNGIANGSQYIEPKPQVEGPKTQYVVISKNESVINVPLSGSIDMSGSGVNVQVPAQTIHSSGSSSVGYSVSVSGTYGVKNITPTGILSLSSGQGTIAVNGIEVRGYIPAMDIKSEVVSMQRVAYQIDGSSMPETGTVEGVSVKWDQGFVLPVSIEGGMLFGGSLFYGEGSGGGFMIGYWAGPKGSSPPNTLMVHVVATGYILGKG